MPRNGAGTGRGGAEAGGGPVGFGTFGGVFTPCVLTILGVIMFLRFGTVVSHAGLFATLLILLVSKAITTLTTLSLSAIATNTRVRGGGAYFLISRSLGAESGSSIGIVFFLAQAVSVAMYVLGFTEAFLASVPGAPFTFTGLATAVNVVVFVCVYLGAGWAIRVQYGILAVLGLSLVSFFVGALLKVDGARLAENLTPDYGSGQSVFTMFALFFPAATGIMAGANMSGDLRDPARSIPRGTLLAVAVTAVVYALIAVTLAATSDRGALRADSMIMRDVAVVGALVTLGVFAATLSSAIGSLMGAPRILQAVARDGIFPRLGFFAVGDGPTNEPRRATVLSFIVAQAAILIGDLNVVAPIITMFFMLTYGYLNLATFYESIIRNPSYRPRFRWSHWSTALAGAIGCLVVMFLIAPLQALVAIALMGLLHAYVARREVEATWGDAQSGLAFERARKALLRLEEDRYHPKNWRPSILALSGGAWNRVHLAVYGHWLTASRGVLTLGQVIPGQVGRHLVRRANQEETLRRFIREMELAAFPVVLVSPSLDQGIEALVQCHGLGSMRPNVVLLGWSDDQERREDFARTLRTVSEIQRSLVVVRDPDADDEERDPWVPRPGTIDVWWRGKQNGHLMVLLAHMLAQNDAWRGREVRLLRIVPSEAGVEESLRHLGGLLHDARVTATPQVIVASDPIEAIRSTSRDAAVVLLGFLPPKEGGEEAFVAATRTLTTGLPTTLLVWSAGDVHLEA